MNKLTLRKRIERIKHILEIERINKPHLSEQATLRNFIKSRKLLNIIDLLTPPYITWELSLKEQAQKLTTGSRKYLHSNLKLRLPTTKTLKLKTLPDYIKFQKTLIIINKEQKPLTDQRYKQINRQAQQETIELIQYLTK